MPNAWMTHVKKTRALMGGNPSLKDVLKQAKKTYKKSGGGVASNASEFSSAGADAQESMGGGVMEGNVNKKGNDSAAHQNAGESADGQSGGRRRRRRRSRKSRRKSRKSKRKGKKSRRSRRKGKKSRKKSRRRRRR